MISIKNNRTGEIKQINESELSNYNVAPQDPESQVRNGWADWLPVAGAVAGSFIPGLGNIAGGALGAGLGELIKQPIQGKKFDVGSVAKESAFGALGGLGGEVISGVGGKLLPKIFGTAGKAGAEALATGTGDIAGKTGSRVAEELLGKTATTGAEDVAGKVAAETAGKGTGLFPKIGGKIADVGESMRPGVSKIFMKPSVYGAGEETAVKATLAKLGIQGTPQEMYTALEPGLNALEVSIKTALPQTDAVVLKTELKSAFTQELKSSMLSGNITSAQAKSEIEGFLTDLNKMSAGKGQFTKIDGETLLSWKRLINKEYQPIANKLAVGGKLSPREQVINVAWDAIDKSMQSKFPKVSTLLTDQSNLYKAARPLDVARKTVPTQRFMGTTIPAPIMNAGGEFIGKNVQNAGNAVSNFNLPAIGAETSGIGKIGTAVGAGLAETGQNPVSESTQNQNGVVQGENGQQGQDNTHTANYITGYSPGEIYQMMMKAQSAGDTKSVSQLRTMYTDETAYQKANPSASGGVLNTNARDAAGLLDNVVGQLINKDGTVNKNLIFESAISPLGHKYEADFKSLMVKFIQSQTTSGRLPTAEQMKMYMDAYGPNWLDSAEAIKSKLTNLRDAIENAKYTKPTADSLALPDITSP